MSGRDEATATSWQHLWKRAADSITRGLNIGGSPLTYALVQGNVEALEEAVSVSPRSRRAYMLCQIDIEGVTISPLYWALNDGKYNVAEFILQVFSCFCGDMRIRCKPCESGTKRSLVSLEAFVRTSGLACHPCRSARVLLRKANAL